MGAANYVPGGEVALLFMAVSLALGALCRQIFNNTRVPYTVALLLVGIALGAFGEPPAHGVSVRIARCRIGRAAAAAVAFVRERGASVVGLVLRGPGAARQQHPHVGGDRAQHNILRLPARAALRKRLRLRAAPDQGAAPLLCSLCSQCCLRATRSFIFLPFPTLRYLPLLSPLSPSAIPAVPLCYPRCPPLLSPLSPSAIPAVPLCYPRCPPLLSPLSPSAIPAVPLWQRCMFQIFLLAVPGVVITTGFLGVICKCVLPYGWSWSTAMLLGSVLSTTDPVAVVALLKELGASKKLRTIIDGEALMNDGAAIAIFQLFLQLVLGYSFSAAEVVAFMCRVFFGGIALGMAFGVVSLLWLRTVFNDYIIEITITICGSYMAFFVANAVTNMSGVMSDMTLGIMFAIFAKTAFTGENEKNMHSFWEMLAYIANTLIFVLSGVVIAESVLHNASHIQGVDWGYMLALFVFVQLSRVVVVGVLYPGLASSGYGLTWKEAIILVWSGLRGGIALTLALVVSHEKQPDKISESTSARFMFITGGIVFLTLIVNGSTTQFIFAALRLNRTSNVKKHVIHFTRRELFDHAVKTFEEIGDDEELGPAEWSTVSEYLTCLDQRVLEPGGRGAGHHAHTRGSRTHTGSSLHAHEEAGGEVDVEKAAEEAVRQQQLADTRLRFLNGVQAAYWSMLEEGRVNQTAAMLLMQAVAEAVDLTSEQHRLCLWAAMRPHVRMPRFFRALHRSLRPILPQRALNWVTVDRLELAASMSAAYIRALRQTRQQLREFLKDSPILEAVILESEEEETEARKFLEDVRLNVPEVLTIIKTKQVTQAILAELYGYVENLDHSGLLDQKEVTLLHNAVTADMKKLQRSPPFVAMLPAGEVLARQPLIGALPADIRLALLQPLKEATKLSGASLFHEGQPAQGVWLIASGTAKWTSKAAEAEAEAHGQHLIPPLFAHGSSVGLYETLRGCAHQYSVTADSVLHCFFIDRQRIMAAKSSSAAIEDFLWKESCLEVARVVRPVEFGLLSMHDLRVLFSQSARLLTLAPHSPVHLAPSEVALLLLGAVRLPGDGSEGHEGDEGNGGEEGEEQGEEEEGGGGAGSPQGAAVAAGSPQIAPSSSPQLGASLSPPAPTAAGGVAAESVAPPSSGEEGSMNGSTSASSFDDRKSASMALSATTSDGADGRGDTAWGGKDAEGQAVRKVRSEGVEQGGAGGSSSRGSSGGFLRARSEALRSGLRSLSKGRQRLVRAISSKDRDGDKAGTWQSGREGTGSREEMELGVIVEDGRIVSIHAPAYLTPQPSPGGLGEASYVTVTTCKLMVVDMPHTQHSLQGTPTRAFHGHRSAPAHDAATLLRWQLEGGAEGDDDDDGFITARLRGRAGADARAHGAGGAAGGHPGSRLGGVLGSMMGVGGAVAAGEVGDVEDSEMTMPRGSELAAMLADRVAVDRQLMERAMQLSVFGNKMQTRPRRPASAIPLQGGQAEEAHPLVEPGSGVDGGRSE
ncbi:unnamed protein product [Closterium sp. Naga37s-1]|nr:unnamed protein product [Closterium sp. Naga37s-1]